MEGILTDIYKQNIQILNGLNIVKELNSRIAKLETLVSNEELTRKQAAAFLNCSEKTIERATLAGELSFGKVGNYTYRKSDLLAYRDNRSHSA